MASTFGGLARKAARKSKTLHWLAGAVTYAVGGWHGHQDVIVMKRREG